MFNDVAVQFTHKAIRDVDDNIFGFYRDSMDYWELIKKYVTSYMDLYYKTENDFGPQTQGKIDLDHHNLKTLNF